MAPHPTKLAIYHDTKSPGTCRSCGASIVWAQLVTGKRMPFDPPVVILSVQRTLTGADCGRVVEYVDMHQSRSHFATCPDANDWRRTKGSTR